MGLTPSALAYLKQKVPQKTSVYWEGHSLLLSNQGNTVTCLLLYKLKGKWFSGQKMTN